MTILPSPVSRLVVLGDIGGQAAVFRGVLHNLGADPVTLALPEQLAVVQVGDLVRAGTTDARDNDACITIAAQAAGANPGRWIQLLGNHDLALLGGPTKPDWPTPPQASPQTTELLRRWWTEQTARLAFGLRCREHGDVLISHAGLTPQRWHRLGAPTTAAAAAALINNDVGQPIPHVIPGGRLTGADPEPDTAPADVTWAEVNTELYEPWLAAGAMPFAQIHGHASPWNWTTGTWWPDTPTAIRRATTVDHATRRTTTRLTSDNTVAISVDWALGNRPTTTRWPPLVLTPTP